MEMWIPQNIEILVGNACSNYAILKRTSKLKNWQMKFYASFRSYAKFHWIACFATPIEHKVIKQFNGGFLRYFLLN